MSLRSDAVPVFRRPAMVLLAAFLVIGAVGCASGDEESSGGGGTLAAGDAVSANLSHVTLRIGDQGKYLETVLRASGELDKLPFKVEFKTFLSGPLLAQGFEAGEIDAGFLGDTPASGTVPAGIPVKALAVFKSSGPSLSLLARPGIKSIEDLKGKKVAFTTGTAQQAVALRALKKGGLKQDDVDQVDVALQQLGAVLDGGSADASIVPLGDVLRYQAAHPDAKVLATSDKLEPPVFTYLLGTSKLLDDGQRSPALFELVASLARAWAWVDENPAQYVQEFHVKVNKQDPAFAKKLLERGGHLESHPIDDEVKVALQDMVDLLAEAGGIPARFDVDPLFDPKVIARSNEALDRRVSQ